MDQNLTTPAPVKRGRWKMIAIMAVCASPVIASYFTYYVIKPTSRNNYGALIDPREHPIPPLSSTTLAGQPEGLDAYKGKWLMVKTGSGACAVIGAKLPVSVAGTACVVNTRNSTNRQKAQAMTTAT